MTKNFNLKTLALATALATTMFAAQASAQNVVTVPATATVQNAITLTAATPMAFATILAINDATEIANMVIATDSSVTFPTSGAPAIMGQVSGTPSAAEVTVGGVSGATINLTINNVVDPTDGTDTLDLNTFTADINAAGSAGVTVGTPVPYTATASDTVLIGATLSTPAQALIVGDGLYTGSFDVVASY